MVSLELSLLRRYLYLINLIFNYLENGEEDSGIKRGKPLYLSTVRYNELQKNFAHSTIDELSGDWKNKSYNL